MTTLPSPERACKEERLVRERGLLEESIVLVPTPQSLVAEGIGRLAPHLLLEGERREAFAAIIRSAGVDLDLCGDQLVRSHRPRSDARVSRPPEPGAAENE